MNRLTEIRNRLVPGFLCRTEDSRISISFPVSWILLDRNRVFQGAIFCLLELAGNNALQDTYQTMAMREYDPSHLTQTPLYVTLHVTSKYADIYQYIVANLRDYLPTNRSRESESRDLVAQGDPGLAVSQASLMSHMVESRDLQFRRSLDLLSDELR